MTHPTMKVSRELQAIAKELEARIADVAGQPVSFSLFVWTEGRASYVSNTKDRANIKAAIHSIIDGWDQGMPDIPAHKLD